jgi:hypothetical protein
MVFHINEILEKKWECNGVVHQLFIDYKIAYDSVRWEVLYTIFIEFGIPRKLNGLINICLNKTYNIFCVGKNLSYKFPIQNGLPTFLYLIYPKSFVVIHLKRIVMYV